MKNNIVLCLASFLVGAGASFLITHKVLEKKYADIAEAEIASMREAMRRAEQRTSIIPEKKIKKKIKDESPKNDQEKKIADPNGILTRSSIDNDPYEKAKRDYHKIKPARVQEQPKQENTASEPNPNDEDEDDCAEETDDAGKTEQDMLDLTKIDRTLPYIIDYREFAEEFDHHDKVSLYYYRPDDVLCEENEEIVEDIEATIGYDALKALDTQTTIWVRNEPLAIDYEIIALNSSFQESVLGIRLKQQEQIRNNKVMTPRERYEARQKRRETDGE